MLPRVLIFGKNIYSDYVEKLQDISISKTFDKMQLITNQYILPVLNRDNQFSINNPVSLFHGDDWLYTPVDIINSDGDYDFRGVLTNVPRAHANAKANLVLKESFFKFRDDVIEYESTGFETGADAFKNICESVGYTDYDNSAYLLSKNILDGNSAIHCNFNKSSGVTFQNAINKIALYSNASVYLLNNLLLFEVWKYNNDSVSFSVLESDLKAGINVNEDEGSMYNDYYINYYDDLGSPAIDSENSNIGEVSRSKNGTKTFVIRGENDSQIIFEDLESAVFIGTGKIQRTHKNLSTNPKPLSFIDFSLYKDFESRIQLNNLFKLTYSRESWNAHIFEPFKYTVSNTIDDINITAYEMATA